MKSLSRVIKSSQVIIDNKGYKLKTFVDDLDIKDTTISDEQSNIDELKRQEELEQIYNEKINKAKEEAKFIINEAYEKAKKIYDNAKKDGYSEGKDLGYNEGLKEAKSIIQESLSIKKEIENTKKETIKKIEKDDIELTIKTIEKILNKKIQDDHETICSLIKLGLDKCTYTENLTLRVSPEDYDIVTDLKDKILALSENISDIKIKQDKSLKHGSCIIDTPSGSVDSSIWTQFEQIKKTFEDILRSE